jgi:hypothetical protein
MSVVASAPSAVSCPAELVLGENIDGAILYYLAVQSTGFGQ